MTRQWLVLVWKAAMELRGIVLAGIAIFWCPPIAILAAGYQEIISIDLTWLMSGLFSILTAVACVCPELHKSKHVFLQSRPISLTSWLITKYIIGLTVVILVTGIPLLVECGAGLFVGGLLYPQLDGSTRTRLKCLFIMA